MNKCEYIINELIVPAFLTVENQEMLLKETEDTGKSELKVTLLSKDNLCISNVDKKKTDFHFFQSAKEKSMYKRVDHMIFERQQDNSWKLYLIEMKGSVGERIPFVHIPVQMERDETGILIGNLTEE